MTHHFSRSFLRQLPTSALTHSVGIVVGLVTIAVLAASTLQAAPIPTYSTNFTSDVFFAASADDLIDSSEPTFAGEVSTGYAAFLGSSTANLNNGTVGSSVTNADLAFDLDGAWTSTFSLDLTNAPLGYAITQIQSFSGWHSGQDFGQQIEVLFSYVGNAGFTSIGTFTNNPTPAGPQISTLITLNDSSGYLGLGVDAVRVNYTNPGPPSDAGAMRELDVFGFAMQPVPEPGTGALLGTMCVAALSVRRGRRKQRN